MRVNQRCSIRSPARSYAADQLFATLDTTTRKVYVEGAGQIVVSDTVGLCVNYRTIGRRVSRDVGETIHADVLFRMWSMRKQCAFGSD